MVMVMMIGCRLLNTLALESDDHDGICEAGMKNECNIARTAV